jgi:hypothetical protein
MCDLQVQMQEPQAAAALLLVRGRRVAMGQGVFVPTVPGGDPGDVLVSTFWRPVNAGKLDELWCRCERCKQSGPSPEFYVHDDQELCERCYKQWPGLVAHKVPPPPR